MTKKSKHQNTNNLIAILTDIHIGLRNSNKFFHDRLFEFLENTFLSYIKEHQIKHLLILGDTFDKRKNIDFATLHDARKRFFDVLLELGVDVKIIYGNHDVYHKNTNEVNSIDLLVQDYPNLEIIKTHKILEYPNMKLGLISWINPSILMESLDWLKEISVDVLAGHFEVNGFEMVKGHPCEHGFSKMIFNKFQMVLSGHFHLKANDGKIFYLGNPLQTNWGDYKSDKGFHVLDSLTHKLEFIKNPIEIYHKILFDTNDFNIIDFDYEMYRDKIVKIQANMSDTTIKRKLDLFFDKLNEYTHQQEIENLDTNKIKVAENVIQIDDIEIEDTIKLIEKYITEVDIDNLDKSRLIQSFSNLYSQAIDKIQEA